jgi:hypothetical protein
MGEYFNWSGPFVLLRSKLSKNPYLKFGYFLSMSQQAVSADIIPNSAVDIFSPETEETKT